MKKRHGFFLIFMILLWSFLYVPVYAETVSDSPGELYALSAVLMDGDSGRILFDKEGETPRPNASTTKVLTCILALENGNGDDYVPVSANAASQPEVKLGMQPGEQYYLEDLLYSLMLKSHNDTAVAIAEYIGGSVENFAAMMNRKAKKIGCRNTHFVTPNGLDGEDSGGSHHTTASDLALIMRYAIKSQTFLKITQTREYAFSDISGKRHFSIQNANSFLDMTDGVLSGKTGFTGKAGYCYVCACKKDDKTFIIALLGCGWPGNRSYKWKDSLALIEYGNKNYHYRTVPKIKKLPKIPVRNAVSGDGDIFKQVYLDLKIAPTEANTKKKILLKDSENITCKLKLEKVLLAPVDKGTSVGKIEYYLGNTVMFSCPVKAAEDIDQITYRYCMEYVFFNFFH